MLNMLVNTNGVEQHNFSKLRVLLSGGAPIAPEIVKKIIDTFHCDYVQTYGMTETSPYLTLSLLKDNLLNLSPEEQFVFMAKTGRPFMGVLLKVVREDGSMIRPDNEEVGEIIVKGDIVTKGYWNRPDETAKAIREGWLYTGDMAVLDQEGYVNIVDRKKDMIITGGENVYSIEVENILYTHEAVLEAAVVGVPHPKWGEAVKAFVVLKPGMYATEENIIEHCKERMAGYKAPKLVAFLSSLPKTGSGKIFKKALKE
jgi:acyl-CoA synthetase (AMP-forming)/AMP-acid ligase II